MKTLYLFFYSILFCLMTACSVSNSSYTPQLKYSAQHLKEDVQAMEQTLKKNHPSLYWYSGEAEINASFERAYALLKDSMNEIEFRNIIAETIFPIRCGHTSVRPSRKYEQYQEGRRNKTFPLGMKILDDSTLIVTINLNRRDSVIRTGTRILAVDELNAKQIIDSMLRMISIDGNSENFSYQNLSNNFNASYNNRFGVKKNYNVTYLDQKGEIRNKVIPVFDPATDTLRRRPFTVNRVPPASPETFTRRQRRLQGVRSFSIDSTNTYATMRLNSFGPGLKKQFLKKSFRELRKKNIEHLIIDVRNNGGGLIKTSLFLTKQIHQKPFIFADSIYAMHRKIRSNAHISKRFIYNLGLFFLSKKVNDSMYAFRLFRVKTYQPGKYKYEGKVYLLTGGYSFSATTLFAASVKGQENVMIIGEETGGGYYGNNGVFIPEMILPNTDVRVRLPLYRIVNNKDFPKNGSGVMPDLEVKPTAETIRLNKDPKMEKAVELIMQRKG